MGTVDRDGAIRRRVRRMVTSAWLVAPRLPQRALRARRSRDSTRELLRRADHRVAVPLVLPPYEAARTRTACEPDLCVRHVHAVRRLASAVVAYAVGLVLDHRPVSVRSVR